MIRFPPCVVMRLLSWARFTTEKCRRAKVDSGNHKAVLVLGIYLADRENAIEHIVDTMGRSSNYQVDQHWIALFGEPPSEAVDQVTIRHKFRRTPKFVLLNHLLASTAWHHYDYILLCDDDVTLPDHFIDNFISAQEELDFALAQPARTHNSFIDHPITEQVDGLLGRETHFVEIGPITCLRNDMMHVLAPFDESAPMGWGLDFVWPAIASEQGKRIGIIDATPVEHSMRPPVSSYDATSTREAMAKFLNSQPHLTKEEAFVVLASYPIQR